MHCEQHTAKNFVSARLRNAAAPRPPLLQQPGNHHQPRRASTHSSRSSNFGRWPLEVSKPDIANNIHRKISRAEGLTSQDNIVDIIRRLRPLLRRARLPNWASRGPLLGHSTSNCTQAPVSSSPSQNRSLRTTKGRVAGQRIVHTHLPRTRLARPGVARALLASA